MKEFLICCIIMASLVACYYGGYKDGYRSGYKAGQFDNLPSQSEIQEALGVEVDGIIGPESRRVWDEMIEQRVCNEVAMPIMEQFERDFDKKYGLDEN